MAIKQFNLPPGNGLENLHGANLNQCVNLTPMNLNCHQQHEDERCLLVHVVLLPDHCPLL